MDLAHLSKYWSKHVEHELTQLFATMGDNWVPHPLTTEIGDPMSEFDETTGGTKQGMDASGVAANDGHSVRH